MDNSKLRFVFPILSLLSLALAPASAQWTQVPTGTTANLRSIWFQNDEVGYCVGGGNFYDEPDGPGVVLRTQDGGDTWSMIYNQEGLAFLEVVAYDDTVVCFGKGNGWLKVLLRSFDGGGSWFMDTIPQLMERMTVHGNTIYYLDGWGAFHQYQNGNDYILYNGSAVRAYHVDGGSYTLLTTSPTDALAAVFSDDLDGGWQSRMITTSPFFDAAHSAIHRSQDTIIAKVIYGPRTYYSFDQGETWDVNYDGPAFAGDMRSNTIQYGVDHFFDIKYSADIGESWSDQGNAGAFMRQFHFLNEQTGFLCGHNGMILKTNTGGFPVGVGDGPLTRPGISIFPNPAKEQVRFEFPEGQEVRSIQLWDSSAAIVRSYGPTERILDLQGLSAGQYLLRIETGHGIHTERIIVP